MVGVEIVRFASDLLLETRTDVFIIITGFYSLETVRIFCALVTTDVWGLLGLILGAYYQDNETK